MFATKAAPTKTMRALTTLLLLPLLWLTTAWAESGQPLPVPTLTSPVMDQAGLLAPADADRLRQKLLALSQEKGSQIAVLIVPTTAPEDIFSFSMRVAESWKLGREGVDDGVLIVIAVQDRRSRIEVGYGLEGAIPDARAKQVLDDIMAPHFRQGDFAGGLEAGTDALISLIQGENLPAPSTHKRQNGINENAIVSALVAGIIAGFFGRLVFGRGGGAIAGFGTAFTVALLLGAAIFVAIFIALFAAFFSSSNGRSGGFSGGSFGGGSFGGGGFSGGGGSFGGGGASGSW